MSEALVIPDSITPYRGYKALNLDERGQLCSPSYSTIWAARKRLEATCPNSASHWGWCPVEGEPRSTESMQQAEPGVVPMTAVARSSVSMLLPQLLPQRPPKPNNKLPEGWNWSWEALLHDSPAEGCGCGIYVADKPEGCISYLGPTGVIAEISLWGKVIRGDRGARGQYAYPAQLLVPRSLRDDAVRRAEEVYGIGSLILDEPLEAPPPPEPRVSLPLATLTPNPTLSMTVWAAAAKLLGK